MKLISRNKIQYPRVAGDRGILRCIGTMGGCKDRQMALMVEPMIKSKCHPVEIGILIRLIEGSIVD